MISVLVGDIIFLSTNNKDLTLRSSMLSIYFCKQAHRLFSSSQPTKFLKNSTGFFATCDLQKSLTGLGKKNDCSQQFRLLFWVILY